MRPAACLAAVLAVVLPTSAARADQCAWMPQNQAVMAAGQLFPGRVYFTLCEPCGQRLAPGQMPNLRRVGRATVAPNPDGTMRVVLDGQDIDVAYVYVRMPSGAYTNLALLAGCPTQGVSRILSLVTPSAVAPAPAPPRSMDDRIRHCAVAQSCGTCTPRAGCGWCSETGACLPTIDCSGPVAGVCGGGWACTPNQCPGYDPGSAHPPVQRY